MDDLENFVELFSQSKFGQLSTKEWDEQITMPEWMIDKLIPAQSIGMLFGPNNSGKSHLVCDLVVSMRNGKTEWQGHTLAPGPVVMFSESHGHIKARLKAYINHQNGRKAFPLYTYPTMSIEPRELELMAPWLHTLPQKPMMVVFDTLSTSFQLEENDNREAARLMKLLEEWVLPAIDPMGCILIVHHTSKMSEGRSARGASALVDNIDWSINVQWDKDIQRTVARWEKDRWRLTEDSPVWAGVSKKVPVEFTNGEAEINVVEWERYDDEAAEIAKELQEEMKLNAIKEVVEREIEKHPKPVFIQTNSRARVPKGIVPFRMGDIMDRKVVPKMVDFIRNNYEFEVVLTPSGAEVGIHVVGSKSPNKYTTNNNNI
jgi:RecA-family ATPase